MPAVIVRQGGTRVTIRSGTSSGPSTRIFSTETALLASSLKDGTIAYATDTGGFFKRTLGSWVSF